LEFRPKSVVPKSELERNKTRSTAAPIKIPGLGLPFVERSTFGSYVGSPLLERDQLPTDRALRSDRQMDASGTSPHSPTHLAALGVLSTEYLSPSLAHCSHFVHIMDIGPVSTSGSPI
jgi:hypothetical protein